jgi:hypothetical protein
VDGLQKLIKPIKSSLAKALRTVELASAFLVFWLGVTQVQVLLKGLELLRSDHNERGGGAADAAMGGQPVASPAINRKGASHGE